MNTLLLFGVPAHSYGLWAFGAWGTTSNWTHSRPRRWWWTPFYVAITILFYTINIFPCFIVGQVFFYVKAVNSEVSIWSEDFGLVVVCFIFLQWGFSRWDLPGSPSRCIKLVTDSVSWAVDQGSIAAPSRGEVNSVLHTYQEDHGLWRSHGPALG